MEHLGGWTADETRELFNLAAQVSKEGKGLSVAFAEMARRTNRKPNSVRNYYYAQAKTLSLLPEMSGKLGIRGFVAPKKADFVTFTSAEVDELIRYILTEQAKGRSVRSITTERAHGDPSVMLRLQNKYRSMVFGRKGYINGLINKMKEEGLTFFNPISKTIVKEGVEETGGKRGLLKNIEAISDGMSESELSGFFSGFARLVEMAKGNSSDYNRAKNDVSAAENERLRSEVMRLKGELERQKSGVATTGAENGRLEEVNRFFLQKADKDKIKSLGDYVSELGKILSEIK